jgi:ATP phosphoribosyltransferase
MTRLKIAIQKSGRLSEKSTELLKECGIDAQNVKGGLVFYSSNFPLDILYLRDDDIPEYVQDGVADIGVIGENVLIESGAKIEVVKRLGFGKCRLSLAVPRGDVYEGLQYFQGKRIATSYSLILSAFLKKNGIKAEVHSISGSVEIAPSIGLADGICDLVSSGSTLLSNGLKEVEILLRSEAVLVGNKKMSSEKRAILEQMLFRMDAVRSAQKNKYIVMNVPNDALAAIQAILPGIKSPTVVPLATPDWSAVHSVVAEERFWEIIDQLKGLGAEGILVMPIEKMIN